MKLRTILIICLLMFIGCDNSTTDWNHQSVVIDSSDRTPWELIIVYEIISDRGTETKSIDIPDNAIGAYLIKLDDTEGSWVRAFWHPSEKITICDGDTVILGALRE